jgi:hypothetical protein
VGECDGGERDSGGISSRRFVVPLQEGAWTRRGASRDDRRRVEEMAGSLDVCHRQRAPVRSGGLRPMAGRARISRGEVQGSANWARKVAAGTAGGVE